MAVVGLRVNDSITGAPILTITDRITRVVGRVSTGTAPGQILVPAQGSIWFYAFPNNPRLVDGQQPIFTVNNNTNIISWTWAYLPGNRAPLEFIYGVY